MERIALDGRGEGIQYVCDVRDCGSVMCSLGYAALCFPRIAGMHDKWNEFCNDVFGIVSGDIEWEFLFGTEWTYIDNTITGAADRIIYFLKHGIPDGCWNPEVYQTS